MYIEKLKDALAIDETYTLENLKLLYSLEMGGRRKKDHKYTDLIELVSEIQNDSLSIPRTLLPFSPERAESSCVVDCRYAMTDDDLSFAKLNLHNGSDELLDDSDSERSDINSFRSLYPNDKTSAFYSTVYYITSINWLLSDHWKNDIPFFAWRILAQKNGIAELFDCIYKIETTDNYDIQLQQIQNLKSYINTNIHHLVESKELTSQEFEKMRLYAQFMCFSLSIEQEKGAKEVYQNKEPQSYLAYYIAESFIRAKDDYSSLIALQVARFSMHISDPAIRQDAFNTLGILAINTGIYLQTSYDIYYSWLNRRMVGDVEDDQVSESLMSIAESEWRQTAAGQKRIAAMRANFAYVCSIIANTYEINSIRRVQFQNIAEEQIKMVIPSSPDKIDSVNFRRYGTYGYILLDQSISNPKILQKGMDQLKIYRRGLTEYGKSKSVDRLNAIMSCISAIMKILLHSYMESNRPFDEWILSKSVKQYWQDLESEYKGKFLQDWDFNLPDERNAYENEKANRKLARLKKLFDFGQNLQFANNQTISEISKILILFRQTAINIKTLLRRLEYSNINYLTRDDNNDRRIRQKKTREITIASYTTLKNATYLFDMLYQKSPGKAPQQQKDEADSLCKNCLTVMNVKYMNDPYEGLALLDGLVKGIKEPLLFPEGSTEQFRESVYNNTFIFLKSFTTKIDKLFMWNRYASDYDSDGSNSNGCCIQFDPEMINRIVSYSASDKVLNPIEDDYYLYRIVYVSKNGVITSQSNPGLSNDVKKLYKTLKKLASELNTKLTILVNQSKTKKSNIYEHLKDEITLSLQETLQSIMFLFKSDDYAEEDESRLIFVRTPDQQDSIRILPKDSANLSKLAINPYKQIYINKIIFGPNVRNVEEWKPYLQYQLNKIWTKYAAENKPKKITPNKMYSIENSKIHYRT